MLAGVVKAMSNPYSSLASSQSILENIDKKYKQVQSPIYTFCALHSRVASGTLVGFNLSQRSSMRSIISAALAACSLLLLVSSAVAQSQTQRGEYLVTIMDCTGCHTPGTFLGKPDLQRPLAGSEVGFQIPGLGIFYPPNLTPDPDTGLGKWSEADIIKAVRTGVRPDGRQLVPIMPYHSYGKLTDGDARALAGYLKSLKPVRNQVPGPVGANEKPSAPYLTVVMPQ
jgi:mono/diheme cytochrome c family protein